MKNQTWYTFKKKVDIDFYLLSHLENYDEKCMLGLGYNELLNDFIFVRSMSFQTKVTSIKDNVGL